MEGEPFRGTCLGEQPGQGQGVLTVAEGLNFELSAMVRGSATLNGIDTIEAGKWGRRLPF